MNITDVVVPSRVTHLDLEVFENEMVAHVKGNHDYKETTIRAIIGSIKAFCTKHNANLDMTRPKGARPPKNTYP